VLGFALVGLVICAPSEAFSQAREAPEDAFLGALERGLNDFAFAEVVAHGRAAADLVPLLREKQTVAFHAYMALAYFPEIEDDRQVESALAHLDSLVQLRPDARLPAELSWPGADSLLEVARTRVFGFSVRPDTAYVVTGPEERGRIRFVTNRSARIRLIIHERETGRRVHHDSVTSERAGELAFRVHDGFNALIAGGAYDLEFSATDLGTSDSLIRVIPVLAGASEYWMLTTAPFDTIWLLPEHERPRRGRTVANGLLFAGLTIGVAILARGGEPLRASYATDARGLAIGAGILAATGLSTIIDRGRPLPANIAVNQKMRLEHLDHVRRTEAENQSRIANYRVEMTLGDVRWR